MSNQFYKDSEERDHAHSGDRKLDSVYTISIACDQMTEELFSLVERKRYASRSFSDLS